MSELHSRRRFLRRSAAIAASACTSLALNGQMAAGAAARLNVGIVGVDSRVRSLAQVVRECGAQLAAYCESDGRTDGLSAVDLPGGVRFSDAGAMIDRAPLDAVIITPSVADGAAVASRALQRGLHVYSPPLGNSIAETRQLGALARRSGRRTQVSLRSASAELVEPLRSGAIGPVGEVVCWSDSLDPREFQAQGERLLSIPRQTLGLTHPGAVFAAGSSPPGAKLPDGLATRYEFPRCGGRPPVRLTWYAGSWSPPYDSVDGVPLPPCGALYLGRSGHVLDDLSRNRAVLLLDGRAPCELSPTGACGDQSLRDWLAACLGETRALAGLDDSAILTQTVLAALVAFRVQQPLHWDGTALSARNCPQAAELMRSTVDAIGCA